MRIALITRRYPPLIGGAEKVLSYLAPALADEGAEVLILTAMPPGSGLPAAEKVATRRGSLAVERLGTSPLRVVGTWIYMRNLGRRLREVRPDLVYVSMLKHDAYVAVGYGKKAGVPVVLRPEGAGATGDLAWQGWGRFGRTIGKRCRQADAVVALSKGIAGELRQGGYAPSQIVAIPNGVPVPGSPWNRREGWRDAPRVAFAGRLAPEKGLDTLLEAWAVVVRAWPTAVLTLYGDGPERPALEAKAKALALGDALRFAGAVADPARLLIDADLFVLPSREEGMSIALLEAMALGVPTVATAIPGNRRLITDFKNGRLVPADHPQALAAAILDQWANLDRALHMGRAARSLVQQKYSIATMARAHLALFRSLARPGV